MQTIALPEVIPVPIHCIPGVKTHGDDGSRDMMRGEETEIMGDMSAHPPVGSRLYIHFGSHNKAILTEFGKITHSVTTMSGELLATAMKHTILTASVGSESIETINPEYAKLGFANAEKMGLTGAFFGARLCAVLDGATPCQVQSYLYGVLTQQDYCAFNNMFSKLPEEIVLYGRNQFIDTWRECLHDRLQGTTISIIPYEESEWLSLRGVQAVLSQFHQKNGGY